MIIFRSEDTFVPEATGRPYFDSTGNKNFFIQDYCNVITYMTTWIIIWDCSKIEVQFDGHWAKNIYIGNTYYRTFMIIVPTSICQMSLELFCNICLARKMKFIIVIIFF